MARVEQMNNGVQQQMNGRRWRSISFLQFSAHFLFAATPRQEFILRQSNQRIPQIFHSHSSGRGFIRKFQNWEFTRKFIGIIGQGGEGHINILEKKITMGGRLNRKDSFHWFFFFWRSQYESGCLILAGASWLNTIVNIAYMLFCNKNVQHCATIFGFVLLHRERAINDGWPSGQIDAGWWAVLRNKINVRPIRPFDWLYNCQNHFWTDRMNCPCKCAHVLKPKCDWSLNRS